MDKVELGVMLISALMHHSSQPLEATWSLRGCKSRIARVQMSGNKGFDDEECSRWPAQPFGQTCVAFGRGREAGVPL